MKADLTRGDRPDGKRGKRYRRVLLQEGRPLLDSDWCAAAEATDAELRRLSRELGCPAGGVGHGFLVTPGPLVAHRCFSRRRSLLTSGVKRSTEKAAATSSGRGCALRQGGVLPAVPAAPWRTHAGYGTLRKIGCAPNLREALPARDAAPAAGTASCSSA